MQQHLLTTASIDAAEREIRSAGGHIAIILTPRLFVAHLPFNLDLTRLRSASEVNTANLQQFSGEDAAYAQSWLRSLAERSQSLAEEGLSWDTEGYQTPSGLLDQEQLLAIVDPSTSVESANSPYLVGGVGLGLVIVSGPTSDLEFSTSEIEKVRSEVLSGLSFLASANPPARIQFHLDTHHVTVNVPPGKDCSRSDLNKCEAPWRDAALVQLGYSPSWAGISQYIAALKSSMGVPWAYIAFFTKYPLGWFAYAGGGRVIMQYANDGWGPNNIHRVFAHESCHIFSAPDEYKSSKCTCDGSYGYFDTPNGNCANCTSDPIACLMDKNTLSLCHWSRRQLGWNAVSSQTKVTDQNDAKTSTAVAAASYAGKLYCTYRGESSATLYAFSFDGTKWSQQTNITHANDAKTSKSPALAAYNSQLYMTYRGAETSNMYICSFDGRTWSKQTKITDINGAETSDALGMAVYQGRLYLAYRGAHSSNLYVCSFDGSTWSKQTKITDINGAKTSATPALAEFNGRLQIVYRGESSSNLYVCSFDGSTWSKQTKITDINGAKTSAAPSLAVMQGLLWLIYRGEATSNIWSCTYDGSHWLQQIELTPQNQAKSSTALGSANLNGALYLVYRGESSSNIWACTLQADAPLLGQAEN